MILYNDNNSASVAADVRAIRQMLDGTYVPGGPRLNDHREFASLDYESSGHTGFVSQGEYANVAEMAQRVKDLIAPNAADIPNGYKSFVFFYNQFEEGNKTPFEFVYSEELGKPCVSNMKQGDLFIKTIDLGKKLTEAMVCFPALYPRAKKIWNQETEKTESVCSLDWNAQPKLVGFFSGTEVSDNNRHPMPTGAPFIKVTQDYKQSQRFFNSHKGWELTCLEQSFGYQCFYQSGDEVSPATGEPMDITGFYASYADHGCLFGSVQNTSKTYQMENDQWKLNSETSYAMGFKADGYLTPGFGLTNVWLAGTKLKFGFVLLDPSAVEYNMAVTRDLWNIVVYGK